MRQHVKSLPFHIPELLKRYPFLAEPFSYSPLYGVSPPPTPSGCTLSSAIHIKSLDNSTVTAVIFLNKVALEKPTTAGHFSRRLAIKAKAPPSHRD